MIKETNILLTLWPPVQNDWEKISDLVSQKFEIKRRQTFRDSGENWIDFIVRLYKLCYELYEHNHPVKPRPNIPKMIPNAVYMSEFSMDVHLIEIVVKDAEFQQYKNGNPYGLKEIKKMKNDIRLMYNNIIPRFAVIHSFDTPVRNHHVIDLLDQECVKV